jgi:hypothetical protein
MKETELYPALKRFLEGRGFTVKGEIGPCDVLAVRGDEEPLVVELKTSLTLGVLLQAVERLTLTPTVYVGVPLACPAMKKRRRLLALFRRLGLGLIGIEPRSGGIVEVLLAPGQPPPRPRPKFRANLLGEFSARRGDPVPGGSHRRNGLLTAYRQKALRLAGFLRTNGPTKAAIAARALDEPKARSILSRNVYGWFERSAPGVYALSAIGANELPLWIKKPGRRRAQNLRGD